MTRRLSPPRRRAPRQSILLWAAIGLVLTICGTFLEAHIPTAPWTWFDTGTFQPRVQSLGTRSQIAAVLLTGCLGGGGAGAVAEIAYVGLGLAGLPIFNGGGGLAYVTNPSFGYLLGFIAGGGLSGRLVNHNALPWLGRRSPNGHPSLERITLSAGLGLVAIHATGLIGLVVFHGDRALAEAERLTWTPLGGQLVLVCAVAPIAWVIRRLLF